MFVAYTVFPQGHVKSVLVELLALHNNVNTARGYLRSMGEQAKVGIEPESQTRLLEHTLSVPGVVGVGVPGAGGVDAVFALILIPEKAAPKPPGVGISSSSSIANSSTVRMAVERAWASWGQQSAKNSVVCPLMLSADAGTFTGVRSEFELKWQVR
jgi:hypothetical protein